MSQLCSNAPVSPEQDQSRLTSTARHYIVATAGHVDHGKSALVKALTGTDPDRLPEEKARGITIELGFAQLQLGSPSTTFGIGIIDVPGHEDFVKTMVAGAGAVDLALLVVAADDGWMPQTEEHLQILSYLGVSRAVVALTKSDLLGPGEVEAKAATIHEKLLGSPFAKAPIVPTSVPSGRGLEELKAALMQLLAGAPPPRDLGKPRLPIDRVFTLPGIGTVVTGTLLGGSLSQGEEVVLQPLGTRARLRSLQSHHRELQTARPGMRTALSLAEVSGPVRRGQVVTLPRLGAVHEACEVLLERSPRLLGSAARPLKDGTRIRFHLGTGNVAGRLLLFERKALGPGEQCLARLRFEAPVLAFVGDRFVLRDWPERMTLAGGIILKAGLCRKTCLVNERMTSPGTALAAVARELHQHRVIQRQALLLQSLFSEPEIEQALAHLCAAGKLVLLDGCVLESTEWNALRERAREFIDGWHKAHPEQPGLSLAQLRSSLARQLPRPEVFDLLVSDLLHSGFVQVGPAIKRAAHRPALPPHLQSAGARLRATMALRPLEPPSRKELAPDRPSQEALRFLLQAGEAVEIGPELVLGSGQFARATESIRQFLRQHGSATVSELRQAVGASRRILVPLLEKLDREGVTRREGDKRVLNT